MNKYERYVKSRPPLNAKIKPWGKRNGIYLIPYTYGHNDSCGVPTDGGLVWWVLMNEPTSRSSDDPNQTPFTIDDLDLSEDI